MRRRCGRREDVYAAGIEYLRKPHIYMKHLSWVVLFRIDRLECGSACITTTLYASPHTVIMNAPRFTGLFRFHLCFLYTSYFSLTFHLTDTQVYRPPFQQC